MSSAQSRVKLVTGGLLTGLILSSADQTIVSTAMPTVVKSLGGGALYSWVFAVYMLAATTMMPIYGKLADTFGRRRIYLAGLSIFVAGSLLCGMAGTMAQLIMFRTVQGLGAGAIMPISLTIAADLFPPERRGKFMGLFGTVFALSSIFGPTLGGVLSSGGHWGWIFLINLPIGLVALAAIAAGLKENVKSDGKRYIDWFGALTLSGAIVSVLVALVLGGSRYVWGSVQTIGLFVLGALLLALFVRIEMRAQDPLVPLHLFRLRAITFGNIAGFWMSAGMYGAIAYMPLFVQNVIGVSPAAAGYMLTPLMLSTVVTSTTSGRMMAVWSYRAILVGSLLLMLAGFVLLGTMGTETSIAQAIAYMVVTGLGMGAVYPALGTAAANAVDWQHRGVAASSSQFCRSIGGAIGVSVLGSLLTQHMAAGAHADKAALSHALDHLFLLGAAFVAISLLASLWLGNARAVATAKR